MVNRGLFVGRFQPFHKGHLHVIQDILKQVGEVIVAIGSAQCSHTSEDPFTAGERIDMIRRSLIAQHIDPSKYLLIPITDVNDNRLWVSHVTTLVPHFDVVFSNKPLVRILFSEAGFKVQSIEFFHREEYSATEIRSKIVRQDEEWKNLVPKEVVDFLLSIKGDERLRAVAATDTLHGKM
ncbi:MAG: nicotinamide-nucleotide adenylyltransferase [Promethearchaeati archaeon SRVP18_Atabeyarchaeia-1]